MFNSMILIQCYYLVSNKKPKNSISDFNSFVVRLKRSFRRKSSSSGSSKSTGFKSSSGLIKEQSESVLRGDHPITFVLPTVQLLKFYLIWWAFINDVTQIYEWSLGYPSFSFCGKIASHLHIHSFKACSMELGGSPL